MLSNPTSNFSRHLKTVEFQVAEDAVVILVRNVKYPAEGSNAQRFELGEMTQGKNISPALIRARMNVQHSLMYRQLINSGGDQGTE